MCKQCMCLGYHFLQHQKHETNIYREHLTTKHCKHAVLVLFITDAVRKIRKLLNILFLQYHSSIYKNFDIQLCLHVGSVKGPPTEIPECCVPVCIRPCQTWLHNKGTSLHASEHSIITYTCMYLTLLCAWSLHYTANELYWNCLISA